MKRALVMVLVALGVPGCCHEAETRDAVLLAPEDEGIDCEEICEASSPDEGYELIECEFGLSEDNLPAAICTWVHDACTYELH